MPQTLKARSVTLYLPLFSSILLKVDVFGVVLVENQFRMIDTAVEDKRVNLSGVVAADTLKRLSVIHQMTVKNLLVLFLLDDVLLVDNAVDSGRTLLDFG